MSNSVRKPIAAAAPLHIAARPATVSATALGTAMQPRATDAPSAAVVVSLVEFIIVVVVIVVELVASTTCVKLAKLQASCLVSRARIKLQTGCQGTRNLSIASRKIKRGMAILAISLPRISSQTPYGGIHAPATCSVPQKGGFRSQATEWSLARLANAGKQRRAVGPEVVLLNISHLAFKTLCLASVHPIPVGFCKRLSLSQRCQAFHQKTNNKDDEDLSFFVICS